MDKKEQQELGRAHWAREETYQWGRRNTRRVVGGALLLGSFYAASLHELTVWHIFMIAAGSALFGPDVVSLLAAPLMQALLPRRRAKSQALYSIARSLVAKGKYAEAEAEYEKIAREFPGEPQAHIGMIEIAVMQLNDGDLAEELFQKGIKAMKKPAAREVLHQAYDRIRTRLRKDDSKERLISSDRLNQVRTTLEDEKHWR